MNSTLRRLSAALVWLIPVAVFAHPGHEKPTLPLGIAHPFTGVDHLLAMVAVGLWAAQLGGRARWVLPATFVAAMAAGTVGGLNGIAVPAVEGIILGSVLLLGAAISSARELPLWAAATGVAIAGAFHGFAHGTELPVGGSAGLWLAGVLVATATLHALGLGAATAAMRFARSNWLRIAGGLITGAGLALAVVR